MDFEQLGVIYSKYHTTFKLFSKDTNDVYLRLYNTYFTKQVFKEVKLIREGDFVYTILEGDYKGKYYTFLVNGKETIDPYCQACSVNGTRGYICDLDETNPIGFKEEQFIPSRTPIIYEMHIRDFTSDVTICISDSERKKFNGIKNGVKTFNGFSSGIDYLKDLGVTYVHLLPIYDFASVDENVGEPFNWGYDPENYNCIEGSYSSNPYDPLVRIKEFKSLVKRLHENNIGVILDVVYNHTYNTDSSLNLTSPNYYYRMKNGEFSNASGCGNETKSDALMYRKFMIDSISYYVKEYHVDGFRFDLMGIHDIDTMNQIRETLDNIYPNGRGKNILMYGEPWVCNKSLESYVPADLENVLKLSERIAIFNPTYRDGMRGAHFGGLKKGYCQGNTNDLEQVRLALSGAKALGASPRLHNHLQQVLYCSCHDDHTLFDHISLTCDDWEDIINAVKRCATATLSGLGMSFFLAGEEFLRTKSMYKNTYNKSDYLNKMDWMRREEFDDVVTFYSNLIELRKNNPEFNLDKKNPDFELLELDKDVLAYRVGKIIYVINESDDSYELDTKKYQKINKLADIKGFKKEAISRVIVEKKDLIILEIC